MLLQQAHRRAKRECSSRYEDEHPDEQLEYSQRDQSIADANMNDDSMHMLSDGRRQNKDTAFHAQQALENAMKAMISAMTAPKQGPRAPAESRATHTPYRTPRRAHPA